MSKKDAAAPAVSVIMPVYNAASHVEAAVMSVLSQTFADLELIAVDDGSTDGSPDRVAAIAARDRRLRLVHRENGGVSAARNLGLQLARGEFVAFIDHDDCYLPSFLEKLVSAMRATHADMARCGRITIRQDGDAVLQLETSFHDKSEFLRNAAFAARYCAFKSNKTFLNAVWSGMYRRQFILSCGVSFLEEMRCGGEDIHFNRRLFAAGASVALLPDILYLHYVRVGQSVSASCRPSFQQVLTSSRVERAFVAANAPDEACLLDYMAMDECLWAAMHAPPGFRMQYVRQAAAEIRPKRWPFIYLRRAGFCKVALWTLFRLRMLWCYAGCAALYFLLGRALSHPSVRKPKAQKAGRTDGAADGGPRDGR